MLNLAIPTSSDDVVDERLAAGVLAELGVEAQQRAHDALQRWLLALRRSSNRRRMVATDGTTAGPTASITWSACPSSSVPSTSN